MTKLFIAFLLVLITINYVQANEDVDVDYYQICVNEVEFQYNYEGVLTIPSKEYEAMLVECFEENKDL